MKEMKDGLSIERCFLFNQLFICWPSVYHIQMGMNPVWAELVHVNIIWSDGRFFLSLLRLTILHSPQKRKEKKNKKKKQKKKQKKQFSFLMHLT